MNHGWFCSSLRGLWNWATAEKFSPVLATYDVCIQRFERISVLLCGKWRWYLPCVGPFPKNKIEALDDVSQSELIMCMVWESSLDVSNERSFHRVSIEVADKVNPLWRPCCWNSQNKCRSWFFDTLCVLSSPLVIQRVVHGLQTSGYDQWLFRRLSIDPAGGLILLVFQFVYFSHLSARWKSLDFSKGAPPYFSSSTPLSAIDPNHTGIAIFFYAVEHAWTRRCQRECQNT